MRRRHLILLGSVVVTALLLAGIAIGGVIDRTPPVITVPSDITTPATNPDGADVSFSATWTDDVDGGPFPASCSPTSGSPFPIATTTVSCSATDAAGSISRAWRVGKVLAGEPILDPRAIGAPDDRVEVDRPTAVAERESCGSLVDVDA